MSGEELGGFDFNSLQPSEPLELSVSEDSRGKIFEADPTGMVKIHGYSVDEAVMLLESYRAHLTGLAQTMQSLVPGVDEVRYRPEGE